MTPQQWHSLPEHRDGLAKLLEDPILRDAIGTLQRRARVVPVNADPVGTAMAYKRLEGYQAAIDDLLGLAVLPKAPSRALPRQFDYPEDETETK